MLAPDATYASVDQGRPKMLTEDLVLLTRLVEQGGLKPVIDRSYEMEQIVEAHRHVDEGRQEGQRRGQGGLRGRRTPASSGVVLSALCFVVAHAGDPSQNRRAD